MKLVRNLENYIKQNEFKIIIKENCINVQYYTKLGIIAQKQIIIYSLNKKITIDGDNLTINKLLNDELLILGNYKKISFEALNE